MPSTTIHRHSDRNAEPETFSGAPFLSNARAWATRKVNRVEPASCPVCDRRLGHEVRLTKTAVRELLRFVGASDKACDEADRNGGVKRKLVDNTIHVPTVLGRDAESYSQNTLSSLRYFGLVEPRGPRGFWHLTSAGLQFFVRNSRVHRTAWVFKGELVGFIEEDGLASVDDFVTDAERAAALKEGERAHAAA